MNSQQDNEGNLLLTYNSRGWSKWFYGAAALLITVAGYDYFITPYKKDRTAGLFVGAGICIIAGLIFNEKASIKVDPALKTITWNKSIAFWRSSGKIKINEVRDVIIETPAGTRKVPSKRISLRLMDGSLLPLTYGASPDPGDNLTVTASLLREFLGKT